MIKKTSSTSLRNLIDFEISGVELINSHDYVIDGYCTALDGYYMRFNKKRWRTLRQHQYLDYITNNVKSNTKK